MPPFRKRTAMMAVFHVLQSFGYYGFGTLVPLVLVAKGFPVVQSLGFVALTFLGYPVGSLLSLPLVERLERKVLLVASGLGMAVCSGCSSASPTRPPRSWSSASSTP